MRIGGTQAGSGATFLYADPAVAGPLPNGRKSARYSSQRAVRALADEPSSWRKGDPNPARAPRATITAESARAGTRIAGRYAIASTIRPASSASTAVRSTVR